MNERIVELFSDTDVAGLKRRIKCWRTALWILAVAAFTACVTMTVLANTRNASRMELAVITVSVVVGWFVIYGSIFVVGLTRRELSHAEMLRKEARQAVAGVVTVTEERIVIRNSITARRVEVRENGRVHRLMVSQSRADALAAAGATVLYAAHSYVAAFEVTP